MKQNIKVFIYVNQVLFLFCKNACVRDCSNNTMHPKATGVTKGLNPFRFTDRLCNHQGKSKHSRRWNGQLGLTACQTPLPNLLVSLGYTVLNSVGFRAFHVRELMILTAIL